MSEKTRHSQKTMEAEMEQTFGNLDDDMTLNTQDQTADPNAVKKDNKTSNSKNKSNLIIFGCVGLAAVGLLGYKFLGGQQQAVQPPPTVINEVPQTPVVQPTPVQAQQPTPVVDQNTVVPPVATNGEGSAAEQYLSGNNPLAPRNDIVKPEPEIKVDTVATVTPQVPVKVETKPEVKMDMSNNPNVIAANNAQTGLTNEIKSLFEKQTQELKSAIDNVGTRVTKLEDSQKSFEDRLSRLETGKSVVKSDNTTAVVKHVKSVKPRIVRKTVVAKNNESSILIDKSDRLVNKAKVEKIEPVYPQVEIHSVYGGRVWTKNSDNSLSTYAVGDRLPSGEVIKSIDDEKYKVVTDKRVLVK